MRQLDQPHLATKKFHSVAPKQLKNTTIIATMKNMQIEIFIFNYTPVLSSRSARVVGQDLQWVLIDSLRSLYWVTKNRYTPVETN